MALSQDRAWPSDLGLDSPLPEDAYWAQVAQDNTVTDIPRLFLSRIQALLGQMAFATALRTIKLYFLCLLWWTWDHFAGDFSLRASSKSFGSSVLQFDYL